MPHVIYVAIGFPPAAKSCAYRMREVANELCRQGWDVTVVSLDREAWELEFGLDESLLARVDPRVRIVELPLRRADLAPEISRYSWLRARHPDTWSKVRRATDQLRFPEPVYGSWRPALEKAVAAVHDEHPADLVLVSPAPNTAMAAALRLHSSHGVPYVVDFRDAWSLDLVEDRPRFPADSRGGRWERRIVEAAAGLWFVNEPIRDWYAATYPTAAARMRVVRNGYEPDDVQVPPVPRDRRDGPMTFGYLGTVHLSHDHVRAMIQGWRFARRAYVPLQSARFEVRGHIGMGSSRGATGVAAQIAEAQIHQIHYLGPVARRDVSSVYAGFDALVLALPGGPARTSGKIYEYMATGRPIVSIHQPDHDASRLLQGYPLWVPAASLTQRDITEAFVRTAKLVESVTPEQMQRAQAYAQRFERRLMIAPAVSDLAAIVGREAVGA
jgi:glycosyltransferase involved in cell wall biosynthesis